MWFSVGPVHVPFVYHSCCNTQLAHKLLLVFLQRLFLNLYLLQLFEILEIYLDIEKEDPALTDSFFFFLRLDTFSETVLFVFQVLLWF